VLKNSLGFVLLNIENNSYYDTIFDNIKTLINNNPLTNIVIFNSNCDKLSTLNIPILHINHAKFFKGDLWLFDMVSLIISKNFTNINRKILYCNDMPWIKNRNNSYDEWKKIYDNNIQFVATNQYLFDIYSICWAPPVDIMETFNHEKIQHILQ
jgi:hypothetical protein